MSKDYRAERNDEVPIVPAGVRKKKPCGHFSVI